MIIFLLIVPIRNFRRNSNTTMPSAFNSSDSTYDRLMFDQYVFHKVLDLGFRVFGGSVRNRIWRSVNDKYRRETIPHFSEKFWDPSFNPETVYNRWGEFNDIDCIGTYEQYAQFTNPEMEKYGDLKYRIKVKKIAYPINGLEIKEGELETFTVKVTPKIRSRTHRSVEIDLFVCKPELLEPLYKTLYMNLDFECNGLCMQKINGSVTTSFLYYGSMERQIGIIDEIKKDDAILVHREVTKTMYHRVAKMIAYGWNVEFAKYESPFEHIAEDQKMFLFARQHDNFTCGICEDLGSDHSHFENIIYIKIGDSCFHFDCYVKKSREYYIHINHTPPDYVEEVEPNVVDIVDDYLDPSNLPSDDESDTSAEAHAAEAIEASEVEPESDVETTAAVEGFTPSEIESLNRFSAFARTQPQVLDDVVPERHQQVQIVGNVVFFDGIAQDATDQEIDNIRRQLNFYDSYSEEDNEVTDVEATETAVSYYLCSCLKHKELLLQLIEFKQYIDRRYLFIRR